MAALSLRVNGATRVVETDDPDTPLLYVLRNDLGLTGTRFGCGLAQCGACTVLVGGRTTRSCVTPVRAVVGRDVTTIEGLGSPDSPDPVQAAFVAEQAAQCGYCTAGLVVTARALLARTPRPTERDVKDALHEEVVFDRRRVTSVNRASYPILTFPEVPAIEFELIQRLAEPPLGVGEAAATPVPAALGNAVFDATGVRLRTVPFRPDRVKAALAGRPT